MKYIIYDGDKISNWHRCNCGNYAEMDVICEGVDSSNDYDEERYIAVRKYKILRCPNCYFVTIIRFAREIDTLAPLVALPNQDIESYVEYDMETLYSPSKRRHGSIPKSIAEVLNQAELVAHTSPRAAFILCRATLEEICREQGMPDNKKNKSGKEVFVSLNEKLINLFELKGLSSDLQLVMNGIKDLGNKGAHDSHQAFVENVTSEEVEQLLSLLDYVLDRLYVDDALAKQAILQLEELKSKVLKNNKNSFDDISF